MLSTTERSIVAETTPARLVRVESSDAESAETSISTRPFNAVTGSVSFPNNDRTSRFANVNVPRDE